MVKVSTLAALLLPALVLAASPAPPIEHPVTDTVGLLSPADVESVASELLRLRAETGVQFAVLVVGSTAPEPLEDYSMRVAEAWKGGGGRDDGLLFTLAVYDRRMRLEVGYGLEDRLPDEVVRRLLDAQLPHVREQRYRDALLGIITSVQALVGASEGGGTLRPHMDPRRSFWFMGQLGFLLLCGLGGVLGMALALLWTHGNGFILRAGISAALLLGAPLLVAWTGQGAPVPASHPAGVLLLTSLEAWMVTSVILVGNSGVGVRLAIALAAGIFFGSEGPHGNATPLDLLIETFAPTLGICLLLFIPSLRGGSTSYSSSGSSSGSWSFRSSNRSFSSSSGASTSRSSSSSSSSNASSYRGGGGRFGGGGASSSW